MDRDVLIKIETEFERKGRRGDTDKTDRGKSEKADDLNGNRKKTANLDDIADCVERE